MLRREPQNFSPHIRRRRHGITSAGPGFRLANFFLKTLLSFLVGDLSRVPRVAKKGAGPLRIDVP